MSEMISVVVLVVILASSILISGCCAASASEKKSNTQPTVQKVSSPEAVKEAQSTATTETSKKTEQKESTGSGTLCKDSRDNCEKISDSEKREQCFDKAGKGAWGDYTCCSLITDVDMRDECILNGFVSQAKFDSIPGLLNPGEAADEDYCKEIFSLEKRDECYRKIGEWFGSKNYDWCGKLSTEELRQACYIKINNCEKITNQDSKDNCYMKKA